LVKATSRRSRARAARALTGVAWSGSAAAKRSWPSCVVLCSAVARDRGLSFAHCASRRRRLNTVRKLDRGVESERTLPELVKTCLHLALAQCADSDSRADRVSKPRLLLSCYQAVDVLRFASRAPFFDKLRSGKSREEHRQSKFHAGLVRLKCRLFGEQRAAPGRFCLSSGAKNHRHKRLLSCLV
jgi:hypothetical protein